MPLAFASILGGMTTLIGTPPNLIVSGFRETTGAGSFAMFDFTPVGIAIAAAGVAFIALVGWRLVPPRQRSGVEGFDTGTYITEARIPEGGKTGGKTVREIGLTLSEADAQIIGFVRNRFRVTIPDPGQVLQAGDILMIEAEPETLSSALSSGRCVAHARFSRSHPGVRLGIFMHPAGGAVDPDSRQTPGHRRRRDHGGFRRRRGLRTAARRHFICSGRARPDGVPDRAAAQRL